MKCTAYIDPKTGIALEGEALVNASKNPDAPRCGYELEPGDMFCPSCGACVEISKGSTRVPRTTFWMSLVAWILVNSIGFGMAENCSSKDVIPLMILGSVGLFVYVYFIKTCVRRLHDIGGSGWLIAPSVCLNVAASISMVLFSKKSFTILGWANLIVYLLMIGWLGFAKGTKGPNKYGPDPLA